MLEFASLYLTTKNDDDELEKHFYMFKIILETLLGF